MEDKTASDIKKKGSKQEVYEGKALCTAGGLKKEDLILNKRGSIVSKKRSEQGKKQFKNIEGLRAKKKEEAANQEQGGAKESEEESEEDNEKIEPQGAEEEKKNVKIEENQAAVKAPEPYIPFPPQQEHKEEIKQVEKIPAALEEAKIEEAPQKVPQAPIKKSPSKKKSKGVSQ